MKAALFLLSLAVSGVALAETAPNGLICSEYGHAEQGEDFDNIEMKPISNGFVLTGNSVIHGNVTYRMVNPEMVGIKGLDITYYEHRRNKVLYIYHNEFGKINVGISHLIKDSDTGFEDKSVYTQCTYLYEPTAFNETGLGVVKPSKVVYRF